jgi:hypothetical protein
MVGAPLEGTAGHALTWERYFLCRCIVTITRKNLLSGVLGERREPEAVVNMIGSFGGIGKGQRGKGRAIIAGLEAETSLDSANRQLDNSYRVKTSAKSQVG